MADGGQAEACHLALVSRRPTLWCRALAGSSGRGAIPPRVERERTVAGFIHRVAGFSLSTIGRTAGAAAPWPVAGFTHRVAGFPHRVAGFSLSTIGRTADAAAPCPVAGSPHPVAGYTHQVAGFSLSTIGHIASAARALRHRPEPPGFPLPLPGHPLS